MSVSGPRALQEVIEAVCRTAETGEVVKPPLQDLLGMRPQMGCYPICGSVILVRGAGERGLIRARAHPAIEEYKGMTPRERTHVELGRSKSNDGQ